MHKDELTLGKIPLPPIYFGGTLIPSTIISSHPSLDLELLIKEINVDLTTDVLNQLLVVQIAFIKVSKMITSEMAEIEYISMYIVIGAE